jgi:hypothetical protein
MLMTEKKLAANRANAKFAGRPKSSPPASVLEWKQAVTAYIAKRLADEIIPIVDGLVAEAKTGNVMAFIALADRAYGKVPLGVQAQDDKGNPIVFMPPELIAKYQLSTQDQPTVKTIDVSHVEKKSE